MVMYLSREEREYNAAKTFLQQKWYVYQNALWRHDASTDEPWSSILPKKQPCMSMNTSVGVSVDPQSQSSLFSRIPTEVRALIWKHLYASLLEQLETSDATHGQICLWMARKGTTRACSSCSRLKNTKSASGSKRRLQILAPVLSCRLAYLEAFDFLYLPPTLKLNRAAFVLKLPAVLAASQFHSIKSLSLSWTAMSHDASPANRKVDESLHWKAGLQFAKEKDVEEDASKVQRCITHEWIETWQVIGSMEGLQHLVVSYHIEYSLFRTAWLGDHLFKDLPQEAGGRNHALSLYRQESEERFWDAVRQVTTPKDFDFYLDGWIVMFLRFRSWTVPCRTRFHNFYYLN